jgi:hypothetical protein
MDMKLFSDQHEFVAMQPFMFDGVDYNFGDPIDKSGMDVRKIKQLCEHRYIIPASLAHEDLRKHMTGTVKAKVTVKAPAPVVEAVEAPQGGFKALHKGFGRWYVVDANGNEVSPAMKQAEAESMANGMNG